MAESVRYGLPLCDKSRVATTAEWQQAASAEFVMVAVDPDGRLQAIWR